MLVTDVAATRNDDCCFASECDNAHAFGSTWMVGKVGGCNLMRCATANPPRVTRDSVLIGGEFAQPQQQTVSKAARLSHRANTSKQLAINSPKHTRLRRVCHCLESTGQPLGYGYGSDRKSHWVTAKPNSSQYRGGSAPRFCSAGAHVATLATLGYQPVAAKIARDSAAQGQMARGRR